MAAITVQSCYTHKHQYLPLCDDRQVSATERAIIEVIYLVAKPESFSTIVASERLSNMGSFGPTPPGLSILIVGAGIAGLATATALTGNGKHHRVTVLESHPGLNEFGASIGILPNGVRGLRSLGIESQFAKVVTWSKFAWVYDGFTNAILGYLPQNRTITV